MQKALSTFAALCLLCAVAAGAPISINTGVAGWTVGGSAVANVTNDPNWAAAPVGSSWVTAPGGQLTPPFYHLGGNYTYTLSLSGLLGLPGELSFSISADNNYQVSFTDITCVGAGCTTAQRVGESDWTSHGVVSPVRSEPFDLCPRSQHSGRIEPDRIATLRHLGNRSRALYLGHPGDRDGCHRYDQEEAQGIIDLSVCARVLWQMPSATRAFLRSAGFQERP